MKRLVVGLTALLVACLSTTSARGALVAHYRFDGNTNDSSGYDNHGELMNGPTLTDDRFGNPNASYAFDGVDDHVRVPDSSSLRPTDVTLSGWYNWSSLPSPNGITTLVEKAHTDQAWDSYVLWFRNHSSQGLLLHGHIADEVSDGPFATYEFTPTIGTWYHIAYTFDDDADRQALYVNGELVDSGTVTKSIAYDDHPVIIGGDIEFDHLSFLFPGVIDDVRIYDHALTQAEIEQLAGDVIPEPSSLIVWSLIGLTFAGFGWWRRRKN